MKYPIVAYGHPTLRKISTDIDKDYEGLDQLIEEMFECMYESVGVGLAAPQIGKNIRLFVIDVSPYKDEITEYDNLKRVFINANIVEETGEEWAFEEGCLSLPEIREEVYRKPKIRIQYMDENFNEKDEVIDGLFARVIQHEYDHLEGKLFVDHLSNMRKMLLKRKLNDIVTGKIRPEYRMKFAPQKRK